MEDSQYEAPIFLVSTDRANAGGMFILGVTLFHAEPQKPH